MYFCKLTPDQATIYPKNVRDFKGDVIPEFNRLKPQLLAYIFDILVKVLQMKAKGGIKLDTMWAQKAYTVGDLYICVMNVEREGR